MGQLYKLATAFPRQTCRYIWQLPDGAQTLLEWFFILPKCLIFIIGGLCFFFISSLFPLLSYWLRWMKSDHFSRVFICHETKKVLLKLKCEEASPGQLGCSSQAGKPHGLYRSVLWGLEYSPYTCKVVSLWSTRWSSPKVGLRVVRGIAQSRGSFLCKGAPWPPKNKDRPERGERISIASASLSALAQVGPASRSRTSWRK